MHVLIVGFGQLGCAVAGRLLKRHCQVTGVRRTVAPLLAGVTLLYLDITDPQSQTVLSRVTPDIVLYCVAASAQTEEVYHQQYVVGLRQAIAAQAHNTRLKHVFFVSSSRVYGQHQGEAIDETTSPQTPDWGGQQLLAAEALLLPLAVPSTVLRLSGIYGEGRYYFIRLSQQPAQWAPHNTWTNRIHIDDAADAIVHLMLLAYQQQTLATMYLVTDNHPVLQYDVLRWLADCQGIAHQHIATPTTIAGKRLLNHALRQTGVVLQYPDYSAGYLPLLKAYTQPAHGA